LGAFAATTLIAAPTFSKAAGLLRGAGDIRRIRMYSGGQPRGLADLRLSQEIAVVGHHRKVERATELNVRQGDAIGVVRLNADALASREAVGLVRTSERTLPPAIEGERRMDVGVTEERQP
jgi:hypothetical protein